MNRQQISTPIQNDPSKKVRTRRILSLEERVRVIREYERKPVYQQMAYMFNCSSDQIKSIICNKESILQYYSNIVNGSQNESHVIRQRKIVFLGKLMYEYINRAQFHPNVPLDTEPIRQKAMEFKKAIKIENFFPNNTWMHNFKTTYDITLPIKHYTGIAHRQPLPSLDLSDIISYVSRREHRDDPEEEPQLEQQQQQQQEQQPQHQQTTNGHGEPYNYVTTQYDDEDDAQIAAETGPLLKYGQEGEYNSYGYGGDNSYPEVVQLESDDDDNRPPAKILRSDAISSASVTISYKKSPTEPIRSTSAPLSIQSGIASAEATNATKTLSTAPINTQIDSYAEALRHLEPLEEFALHQENYRAIGLISQLESIFRNPPKRSD